MFQEKVNKQIYLKRNMYKTNKISEQCIISKWQTTVTNYVLHKLTIGPTEVINIREVLNMLRGQCVYRGEKVKVL